jgi:Na+/H+ antiporter NhaD/arsenite permease-like protein
MNTPAAILAAVLILALVAQAIWPQARLLVLILGAAISGLLATLTGTAGLRELLAQVPWGVLVMVVALGLLAEMLALSRLFGVLAGLAVRATGADPRLLLIACAGGMFLVSGLVNNLTALVLILPPVLVVLQLIGADRRYAAWMLGLLIVACNLGGAATPIGDFPAILLLGSGVIGFGDYLVAAMPICAVAMAAIIAIAVLVVRPWRDAASGAIASRIAMATMNGMYRRVRVDWAVLGPAVLVLVAMIAAWAVVPGISGVSADLICWLGVIAALLGRARLGERLLRTRVDIEAVLFLLALFVMVGAVRATGAFEHLAGWLAALPMAPDLKLALLTVVAGVATGLFSAGPSMAALLEVAPALAGQVPVTAIYVGLALGVCAGSSLLLTAATSGPLAQSMVDRAGLVDVHGQPIRFGFAQYLPIGLIASATILIIGVIAVLVLVEAAPRLGLP